MKTFFLLFTLKICALLLMNFLWGFIAAYVLQLVTPNSILCNLHGFFKNYRLLILAIIFFINFEFNLDSNTIYTSNHDGENILNNDLNQCLSRRGRELASLPCLRQQPAKASCFARALRQQG